MERAEFLPVLQDSFSAYYDIFENDDGCETDLPLVFRADYYSRAEKYWLSKNIKIWANETNEFAYIFSSDSFDNALIDECIRYALDQGLPRVKPHREHQYTHIKVIFIADSFDRETAKYIQKKKYSKNYMFSLHGFTELKTAAVDLGEEKAYPNPPGHELVDYFSKLFAANRK